MPRLDQVQAFRGQLNDLNEIQVARLIQLWSRLIGRPDEYIRDALLVEFPQLVDVFAGAAADLTVEWYDGLGPAAYRARPAPLPSLEQLEASTRWAASALTATGTALPVERLAGTAQRALFNASRDTVALNVELEGTGWARYASANACEFCRMLATRGAVYGSKSAATSVVGRGGARGARTRGSQPLESTYHDHCRCMAVPVRGGDTYDPPGYVEDWAAQYTQARAAADGVDTKSILAAWRQL